MRFGPGTQYKAIVRYKDFSVRIIVASNAILQGLRIGKQCNPARIAGCLLDGSAPKPLKTRACALWL